MIKLARLKFRLTANWVVLLVVLIIVAGSTVLGRYVRSQRLGAPGRSFPALVAQLNQVVLTASSLGATTGSDSNTYYALQRQQTAYKSSLDASTELADKHQKALGNKYAQIYDALAKQRQLYKAFGSRFTVLSKVIAYNPSLDLGESALDERLADELAARAAAAKAGVETARKKADWKFADDTYNAATKAQDCFDRLESQLRSRKLSDAQATRNNCVELYKNVTATAVSEVVATLKTTAVQTSVDDLADLIATLPKN